MCSSDALSALNTHVLPLPDPSPLCPVRPHCGLAIALRASVPFAMPLSFRPGTSGCSPGPLCIRCQQFVLLVSESLLFPVLDAEDRRAVQKVQMNTAASVHVLREICKAQQHDIETLRAQTATWLQRSMPSFAMCRPLPGTPDLKLEYLL